MENLVRVLFIGDVVGLQGCKTVEKLLPQLKLEKKINFVVANAENSAPGNGVSMASAKMLFDCGCNVLTGGNHVFKQHSIFNLMKQNEFVLRPSNLSKKCPGKGYCVFTKQNFEIVVINLIGQVYLNSNGSAFDEIDFLLKKIKHKLIIVDFHAEATGEKGALAHYLNGKVSVVFGTHTHVQTNDARILSKGTGFITDVGMVGPYFNSVLGVNADCIIRRMTTQLPTKFEIANSNCVFNGVIVDLNIKTGVCEKIEIINKFNVDIN